MLLFSPRMRGCFRSSSSFPDPEAVLPAYAGMFLPPSEISTPGPCSPRVCGDVSEKLLWVKEDDKFSPRMRGCFYVPLVDLWLPLVLPAYAGMFPYSSSPQFKMQSSPRVCGDVSKLWFGNCRYTAFSPRMRGCFPAWCLQW